MIHYLPIDIPKLDIPSSINYNGFVEEPIPYHGSHMSLFLKNEWFPQGQWQRDNWSWLKKYIEENLPIKKFYIVRVSIQLSKIGIHFDTSGINERGKNLYNENLTNHYNSLTSPYGYRLVISGKSGTLLIHNDSQTIPATLPDSTNCYCLNSFHTKHSTDDDDGRVIALIQGWLDEDKHNQIINRSLLKYKEHIIAF